MKPQQPPKGEMVLIPASDSRVRLGDKGTKMVECTSSGFSEEVFLLRKER